MRHARYVRDYLEALARAFQNGHAALTMAHIRPEPVTPHRHLPVGPGRLIRLLSRPTGAVGDEIDDALTEALRFSGRAGVPAAVSTEREGASLVVTPALALRSVEEGRVVGGRLGL